MADVITTNEPRRCGWCGQDPLYHAYHDQIWGRPEACDQSLLAKLCLDGQQAGLSWITILRKQPAYEIAFAEFDPDVISTYTDTDVERLMGDTGIVRNRLKIHSIIRNARAYVAMREAGEPFAPFLWGFVGGAPLINEWRSLGDVPTQTGASRAMSKALTQRGFNFVGPTICYAFMQATGMVMDHITDCHCYESCRAEAQAFRLGNNVP